MQNIFTQTLCYVQAELHLKSGMQTVGEPGPGKMGDLNPGQQVTSVLSVPAEPELAGVAYDGYVVHMEVFDCGGPGPVAHTGAEGGKSGSEGAEGTGSEEGSGVMLASDDVFDEIRGGARLVMIYDAPSNTFIGIVHNATDCALSNVRVEVHLSNGAELGPTTPVNIAAGEIQWVALR